MAASPEQRKQYHVTKDFKGINTKANRTSIAENEFAWLENAMPIGYANLKTVPTYQSLNVNLATASLRCSMSTLDSTTT
jgi:hypothetical protein